jgi:hypothetical protein
MSDPTVTMRRRLQAAENLLAYKTPQDVAEAAKQFLASIFTDPEQNIDHRLAATTALRKCEDVRIMPAIERPSVPTRVDTALEIEERHERRRKHIELQAAKNAEELARETPDCSENEDRQPHFEA